jgi:hypothetical protein
MGPRRYVPLAILVVVAGLMVGAAMLTRPTGLASRPVSSVPELLSEPAGVPGAGLVLAPDGLGPVAFGQVEDGVLTKLTEMLGDPVEDSTEPCAGRPVRWVRWGSLTAYFADGQFGGYLSGIYFPPDSPELIIKTAEKVGLRATVRELAAAYGDRFDWFDQPPSGFGIAVDAFGIDGFDVGSPTPTGLGGYVEGGREEGHVITFLAGQPCVDNGP